MASITDVAKKAGVSVKTVSRILSGQDNVADKTKDKVSEYSEFVDAFPETAKEILDRIRRFKLEALRMNKLYEMRHR